ncbi:MAG: ShlB/FhaC/HecB family hemolysin secretion/activation protein [Betaproteobacteria bacterium]|nr:ShlB/FhaC/HecB family hemolysin secretion/activation protein [Betaproteobacteria bacterium]
MMTSAQVRPVEDPIERLLREQRERQRDAQSKERPTIGGVAAGEDIDRLPPAKIAETGPTFPIDRIRVTGNTLLKPKALAQTVAPFQSIELGTNRINALLRRLTKLYFDEGFITTRVYLGPQSLSERELEITVVEGFIERIDYREKDRASRTGWALPFAPGERLSLWRLEQGLEQLNRLSRNRAELQIVAGERPGGSVIEVSNRPSKSWTVSGGVDNFGQPASGQNRLRATLELENLTGLQESTSLTYSGSRETNAVLFAASVPLGFSTLSYSAAYSEYQSPVGDFALLFGDSRTQTVGLNRVIGRDSRGKTAVDLSLVHRHSRRIIDDVSLIPQRLTNVRLSGSRTRRFDAGNLVAELGWVRGTKIRRATTDPAGIDPETAHAQFNKLEGFLTLQRQWGQALLSRHTVQFQYSSRALFGADQIYVGGLASVRGFADSTIVGDQGLFSRNELSRRFAPQSLRDWGSGEVYVAADAGGARQVFESRFRGLAGVAIGARAQSRSMTAELSFARGIAASPGIAKASVLAASLNFRL